MKLVIFGSREIEDMRVVESAMEACGVASQVTEIVSGGARGVDRFELYNESKTRKAIEQNGRTLDFPELANRVADKLYSERLPIWEALAGLPLGDRAELLRWRSRCGEMFGRALPKNRPEVQTETGDDAA